MATYYNSVITYDSAVTAYNGAVVDYAYTGSITISVIPSYVYTAAGLDYYNYTGNIPVDVVLSFTYQKGAKTTGTVSGITIRVVPNSSTLIRQYYKHVADPVRTGGCPQCGCFTYNQ